MLNAEETHLEFCYPVDLSSCHSSCFKQEFQLVLDRIEYLQHYHIWAGWEKWANKFQGMVETREEYGYREKQNPELECGFDSRLCLGQAFCLPVRSLCSQTLSFLFYKPQELVGVGKLMWVWNETRFLMSLRIYHKLRKPYLQIWLSISNHIGSVYSL